LAAGIWSEVDMDRRQIVLAEVRTKNARAHGHWRRRMSSKQKNEIPPDLLDERMLSPAAIAKLDGTSVKTVPREISAGRLTVRP
jgi:hypothetical protein